MIPGSYLHSNSWSLFVLPNMCNKFIHYFSSQGSLDPMNDIETVAFSIDLQPFQILKTTRSMFCFRLGIDNPFESFYRTVIVSRYFAIGINVPCTLQEFQRNSTFHASRSLQELLTETFSEKLQFSWLLLACVQTRLISFEKIL